VDQATEAKLHRSPEVVSQIEAARREVLARAYVQQVAGALPKPSPEEVKKYYVEHPQLFSERRIFALQEILIPAAAVAANGPELRAQIASAKSMEDIATWLRSKDIKFGGGSANRPAEQIPLELLAKVHALKDGQSTVIQSQQGLTVLRVASSQSAPVPEAAALPRVELFLANQRSAEAVTKSIKELRAKANVTYMGDFAQAAGAVNTAPATPSIAATPAAAMPEAAPAATLPAAPAAADASKAKTALEKGVAGLK